MRHEDISLGGNQLPLLSTSLPAHQVEPPRVKLWLPRSTPDPDTAYACPRVKQILAIWNALDHLNTLSASRGCVKIWSQFALHYCRTIVSLAIKDIGGSQLRLYDVLKVCGLLKRWD